MNTVILIQLLLAHILTDFLLQTPKMVENKNSQGLKSKYFWIHIILAGTLTYVILMQWTNWLVPLFIIITHGFIDIWKIKQEQEIAAYNSSPRNNTDRKTTTVHFVLDQLFHIIVIIIAWVYLTETSNQVLPFIESLITEKKYVTVITAFILVAWPVGLAIGKITEPFRNEFSSDDSLNKAGKYIGIFERLLVMIFVLMGQFAAIGFLIAAKSVLRISKDNNDNDGRKKTEYVLIGTLISFTIAILVGLLTKYIISN